MKYNLLLLLSLRFIAIQGYNDMPRFMMDHGNITASCSANEECSNLAGDCCPTSNDVDLFCCGKGEETCASNPRCAALNLTGACCPTTDNRFLECCERPAFAACAIHPFCSGLDGDCCPTSSGVILDCCLDDLSLANLTFPDTDEFAKCSANSACAGLAGDCCPTQDGTFLYCCGESERNTSYAREITLVSPNPAASEQATYFVSSSPYIRPAFGAERSPVVQYTRNSTEVYDLIYYETDAIPNAGAFLSERYKFYMDVWTDAPPCTQIIIQLDSLPKAMPDNYPNGRHSRYVSFTTMNETWERIEFDLLDRLDELTLDTEIDALVLFFNPGSTVEYTWFFDNLDIAADGCTVNCEEPSLKNCSAYFGGEDIEPVVSDPETESPTYSPSASPTFAPTGTPTADPTAAPTSSPSASPTASPTATPTMAPTNVPTLTPSASPTAAPTSAPTGAPTSLPTSSPSFSPTDSPTTLAPTGIPTATPTTATPTAAPTTASPTSSPSDQPTEAPTATPTTTPTMSPTDAPSSPPTGRPSPSPSSRPTGTPTSDPTSPPTLLPTDAPSSSPTKRPTPMPTPRLFNAPTCSDGKDNDRDGLADCEDPDCFPTIQCGPFMILSYQTATAQLRSSGSSLEEPTSPPPAPDQAPSTSASPPMLNWKSTTALLVLMMLRAA